MSTSIQETNSFPEDIFCPSSDTQDSQQDELLYNHNPFTTTNESSNSFQQMIQKTFDFASIVAHENDIQNDILQWEQRLKAESSKSKALRLKQLKYYHRSGSNGNKAKTKKKKGLSKEVVSLLEVMENDAEVEVGRLDQWQQQQQQGWSLGSGSATTNEQHNNNKEEEEETQTKHYKDSLYRLGILETKITTHEAAIRKCTRPSIRLSVGGGGGGGEHHDNNKKQQAKQLELQHHKLELAKAEGEMIEMRKIADAQLRGLFLMKLCKELEVQEEAVRRKEADVKKWEIILKKAQEGCL